MKLAPVLSLAQLKSKALRDENYKRLVVVSANEMTGYSNDFSSFEKALPFIQQCVTEEGEEGVIEEINAYIPLV